MTRNYRTIGVKKENNKVNNVNVTFNTLRSYITLYHTYKLLNCKGHIHMTRKYSTIDVKKNNRVKNVNITFNTLRNYITLYHTYKLLNCKGHIQMIRNYSTIIVEKTIE